MKSNKLFFFLSSTFFITLVCWWMLVILTAKNIIHYGQVLFMVLYMLGGLGPIISVYLSILITKEKNGLKEFHNHLFKWKISIFWYVIPFVISFGILFVSNIAYNFIANRSGSIQNIKPWFMIFPLFIQMLLGGGVEEPGWRGIVLPELERKYNTLFSSLILGVIWVSWHIQPEFDLLKMLR